MATLVPRTASASAIARPRPWAPLVTMAVVLSKGMQQNPYGNSMCKRVSPRTR